MDRSRLSLYSALMGTDRGRLAHLDGLRGIAILMVVVFHAWEYVAILMPHSGYGISGFWIVARFAGNQGVALFLVLSGVCLSLGPLQRRVRGEAAWFVPQEFFSRRCLRILPPY